MNATASTYDWQALLLHWQYHLSGNLHKDIEEGRAGISSWSTRWKANSPTTQPGSSSNKHGDVVPSNVNDEDNGEETHKKSQEIASSSGKNYRCVSMEVIFTYSPENPSTTLSLSLAFVMQESDSYYYGQTSLECSAFSQKLLEDTLICLQDQALGGFSKELTHSLHELCITNISVQPGTTEQSLDLMVPWTLPTYSAHMNLPLTLTVSPLSSDVAAAMERRDYQIQQLWKTQAPDDSIDLDHIWERAQRRHTTTTPQSTTNTAATVATVNTNQSSPSSATKRRKLAAARYYKPPPARQRGKQGRKGAGSKFTA